MVVSNPIEWPDSGDIFLRGFDSQGPFVDTVNFSGSVNGPYVLPAGTPLTSSNVIGAASSTLWQKMVYKTVTVMPGLNKVAVIDAKGTSANTVTPFAGTKLNLSCVPLRNPTPGSVVVWDVPGDWIPFCNRYGIAYSEESTRQDNQPK